MQYPTFDKLEFIKDSFEESYSVRAISSEISGDVIIPESYRGIDVSSIADSGFEGCSLIKTVTFPSGLKKIGNSSFACCSSLSKVEFGITSLIEIGDFAFFNCPWLEIVIPKTVAKIGINAVDGCYHFKIQRENPFFVITDDRSICSKINGRYAYISRGTKVFKLSSNEPNLDTKLLNGCSTLEKVEVDEDNPYFSSLDGVVFDKTVSRLLYVPKSKNSIYIPKTTIEIDFGIMPSKISSIAIDEDNPCFSSFGDAVFDKKQTKLLFCPLFKQQLLLPKNVERINFGILNKLDYLVRVDVEGGNKYFSSFDGVLYDKKQTKLLFCPLLVHELTLISSNIKINKINHIHSLIVSSEIKNIDYNLMRNFQFLSKLIIQSRETIILDNSLKENTGINEIQFYSDDNSFLDFVKRTFGPITSLPWSFKIKKVVLLDMKTMPDRYFINSPSLEIISVPNGVISIGNEALKNCVLLSSIDFLTNELTSIGNEAFYGCSSLASIDIPDSVLSIGKGTFYGCKSLTHIDIPDSIKVIEEDTFKECTSLKTITLSKNIIAIGRSAFSFCRSLASINIPDSVLSIGDFAFSVCDHIEIIYLPDSLTSIGMYSFSYCSSLTSISIPKSVVSIGKCAFDGCKALSLINYRGTMLEWQSISFGEKFRFPSKLKMVRCIDGEVAI